MSASRRLPRSRFQPGIAAMYACTGASPSAFAMRGLPPERTIDLDLDLVDELTWILQASPFLLPRFGATADRTRSFRAPSLILSPSWRSMAISSPGKRPARSGGRRRGLQAAPENVREPPEHAGGDRPTPRLRA